MTRVRGKHTPRSMRGRASLNIVKPRRNANQGRMRVDRHDVRYHLANSRPYEIVLAKGRRNVCLGKYPPVELQFSRFTLDLQLLLRLERMDRHGQVIDAMFNEALVSKQNWISATFSLRLFARA